MPDAQPKPEEIEITVPETTTGTVKFLNKSGFANPAPRKLKIVISGIQYTCTAMITYVAGTDFLSGGQVKRLAFILGAIVIVCGAILKATGVEPAEDKY